MAPVRIRRLFNFSLSLRISRHYGDHTLQNQQTMLIWISNSFCTQLHIMESTRSGDTLLIRLGWLNNVWRARKTLKLPEKLPPNFRPKRFHFRNFKRSIETRFHGVITMELHNFELYNFRLWITERPFWINSGQNVRMTACDFVCISLCLG